MSCLLHSPSRRRRHRTVMVNGPSSTRPLPRSCVFGTRQTMHARPPHHTQHLQCDQSSPASALSWINVIAAHARFGNTFTRAAGTATMFGL